jgi:hypothetical protein
MSSLITLRGRSAQFCSLDEDYRLYTGMSVRNFSPHLSALFRSILRALGISQPSVTLNQLWPCVGVDYREIPVTLWYTHQQTNFLAYPEAKIETINTLLVRKVRIYKELKNLTEREYLVAKVVDQRTANHALIKLQRSLIDENPTETNTSDTPP